MKTIELDAALCRTAHAAWISEDWNVAEKAMRVAGDYRMALFYRARSVVTWDRALREFDRDAAMSDKSHVPVQPTGGANG